MKAAFLSHTIRSSLSSHRSAIIAKASIYNGQELRARMQVGGKIAEGMHAEARLVHAAREGQTVAVTRKRYAKNVAASTCCRVIGRACSGEALGGQLRCSMVVVDRGLACERCEVASGGCPKSRSDMGVGGSALDESWHCTLDCIGTTLASHNTLATAQYLRISSAMQVQ